MGLPEVVGTVQQVHCSRRRLLRRGLEFHECTINKSAHPKKSLETCLMILVYIIRICHCMTNKGLYNIKPKQVNQPKKYILCADTGCNRENLPGTMDDTDGWCVCVCVCVCTRERERERESQGTLCFHHNFIMMINIFIQFAQRGPC